MAHQRLAVTIDEQLLQQVDAAAAKEGLTRSAWLARAATDHMAELDRPTNSTTLSTLRELAQNSRAECFADNQERNLFLGPDFVISLLDEIERLRVEVTGWKSNAEAMSVQCTAGVEVLRGTPGYELTQRPEHATLLQACYDVLQRERETNNSFYLLAAEIARVLDGEQVDATDTQWREQYDPWVSLRRFDAWVVEMRSARGFRR